MLQVITMKIVTLVGLKKTGKTTSVSALITEFKKRGMKVGGLKSMVHSTFTIDTPGKDTYRQKEAGAEFIVSLSKTEMAFVQDRKEVPGLFDALKVIPRDTEILVCEGLETDDPKVLKLVALNGLEFFEETCKIRGLGNGEDVVALTGRFSNDVAEHPRYPVFNCTKEGDVSKLADLILDEAVEY